MFDSGPVQCFGSPNVCRVSPNRFRIETNKPEEMRVVNRLNWLGMRFAAAAVVPAWPSGVRVRVKFL